MFIGIVTKLLLYGTFCIAVKYCFVCVLELTWDICFEVVITVCLYFGMELFLH